MTRDPSLPTRHIYPDIPLPGFYELLTWQLNVTAYGSGRMGKFVSVIRQPKDQLEIIRAGGGVEVWEDVAPDVLGICHASLSAMEYLLGLGTPQNP